MVSSCTHYRSTTAGVAAATAKRAGTGDDVAVSAAAADVSHVLLLKWFLRKSGLIFWRPVKLNFYHGVRNIA